MTPNDWLTDKRIVRRNIEQGKLDSTEYDKLLAALPDLSDKVWRRPEGAAATPMMKKSVAPAPAAVRSFDYLATSASGSTATPGAGSAFASGDLSAADDDDDLDDDDDDLDDDLEGDDDDADADEDDVDGDDDDGDDKAPTDSDTSSD